VAHIKTCDPYVVIESQAPTSVIYLVPHTGERWRIDGVCNHCGACYHPASVFDPTVDCPVRPEINKVFPTCTLSGEYL
jgi:hypothetical protein